jgi:hypothetical protein
MVSFSAFSTWRHVFWEEVLGALDGVLMKFGGHEGGFCKKFWDNVLGEVSKF